MGLKSAWLGHVLACHVFPSSYPAAEIVFASPCSVSSWDDGTAPIKGDSISSIFQTAAVPRWTDRTVLQERPEEVVDVVPEGGE